MKILLSFLIFLSFSVSAQNKHLKLEISGIRDTISQEKDLRVSLKLSNNDNVPVIIPSKFITMSDNDSTDISYEIVYLNQGKIEVVTKHTNKWSIDGFIDLEYRLLQPNQSTDIIFNLDYFFFKKIGNYKIRATFRAAKINRCDVGNVSTDWIPFYVKNANIVK